MSMVWVRGMSLHSPDVCRGHLLALRGEREDEEEGEEEEEEEGLWETERMGREKE